MVAARVLEDGHGPPRLALRLLREVYAFLLERLGGREDIVAPKRDGLKFADAMLVARTLTQLLEHPILLEGNTLHIGASVGVAVFPEDAGDAEALCIAADVRMYASKRAARSREERAAPATLRVDPFPSTNPDSGMQVAE